MAFVLNSDITIGIPGTNQFRFSGVHSIYIKRSMHSFVDTAVISLPSVSKVKYKNKLEPIELTTSTIWNDGDPVTISLGYNKTMQEEFRGFIRRRNLNMPLEIECEGYSWLLKKNKISGSWKSISVEDLLKLAVSGLPNIGNTSSQIKLTCIADITLCNVQLSSFTGAEVIEYIHRATDHVLTIFFINPDELWCGLPYTDIANNSSMLGSNSVQLKLGYNTIKENSLKQRTLDDNKLTVLYKKRLSTGQTVSGIYTSTISQKQYKKLLTQVADEVSLKKLAVEKQLQENYNGYEGNISGFLQPYTLPGYSALIKDKRYPQRDGIYLVESTEVSFGTTGGRRAFEIGKMFNN